MICASVNLLFFMSVILLVDGLHCFQAGTAGWGQIMANVSRYPSLAHHCVERLAGIEPALSVWETEVLPLNDGRAGAILERTRIWTEINPSVRCRPASLKSTSHTLRSKFLRARIDLIL
jgi:hypothetical protein